MSPTSPRARLRNVVLATALLSLALAGAVQGLPAPVPDPSSVEDCLTVDKNCVPLLPLGEPTEDGYQNYQYWMHLLGPFLDRDTELLLRSIWPHDGLPAPVPVPPRPQGVDASADLRAQAEASLLGIRLDADVHVHANASASLVGHGGPEEGQVPCSDVRGCPDLLVDAAWLLAGLVRQETFAADNCNVVEGSTAAGTRRLLRFTSTLPNLGDGDLIVGNPSGHPQWFEWGECHDHWHFKEYADYRLWKPGPYMQWRQLRQDEPEARPEELLDRHPELRQGFVAGHKQGFCVIDIIPYLPIEPPKYWSCDYGQGVSRGWADQYNFLLDGQFVDVTDLPAGAYVLDVEANPERLYQEIDYSNNSGAVLVVVPPM